ncbi:MAG: phosphomannomutase/phosphoglucomutase [Candidatus Aminicenantia bacterium]
MLAINPNIFREYDIRGIVGTDLTVETVEILGRAIGTIFGLKGKKRIAIGRDARLSSKQFSEALMSGLLSTGRSSTDFGMVPTPVFYFGVITKKMDGGVMITGSHNPPEFNGFKIMIDDETLYGEEIKEIERVIQKGRFLEEANGSLSSYQIVNEYIDFVLSNIKIGKKLKIVIDAGNGTGGFVASPIYKALGMEVFELYCDPDGNFPNHHPDPTIPEYLSDLIDKVKIEGSDLGIAFDGDADRIGLVDEKGNILWGDQIMIILSRSLLKENPGAKIIGEVKSSKLLYDEISRLGGIPIMWKTGHSLIKKKIKEEKALLAGEMSGHIFFADRYFGFDDAIYAGARIIEILSKEEKPLSKILEDLPKTFTTPEIRIPSSDELKFKVVEEVKKQFMNYKMVDVDGVRIDFGDGWGLVRASNTQPVLVLRFEAFTEEALKRIRNEVEEVVKECKRRVGDL